MIIQRSKLPCFDICALRSEKNGDTVFIVGGGGGMKSGVTNAVEVARGTSKGLKFDMNHTTGSKLGNCITAVASNGREYVAVGISGQCRLYEVVRDKEGAVVMQEVFEFQVDFSDGQDGPDVKCITFLQRVGGVLGGSGLELVTGGADGVCRLWSVDQQAGTWGGKKWKAKQTSVLMEHDGPINSISTCDDYVFTAGKDGWLKSVSVAKEDGHSQSTGLSKECLKRTGNQKLECRSVACVRNGSLVHVYAIFSGPKATILGRYSAQGRAIVTLTTAHIAKCASTRVAVNQTGEYVAVGMASGEVALYWSKTLALLTKRGVHDFTLTGLAFIKNSVGEGGHEGDADEALVSLSVDSRQSFALMGDLADPLYQIAHRIMPAALIGPDTLFGCLYLRAHFVWLIVVMGLILWLNKHFESLH